MTTRLPAPAAVTRPPAIIIATSWVEHATSYQFRALAQQLAGRGYRVILLLDKQRRDLCAPAANPAVMTWPSARPTGLADLLFLRRLIRRERPAALVANFGAVGLLLPGGAMFGVPVRIAWYHSLAPDTVAARTSTPARVAQALRLARRRFLYRFATHLVPVSLAAQQDLVRVFQVPTAKCQVLHNFIADPGAVGPATGLPAKSEEPSLACVGELSAIKGQDVLVEALKLLVPQFPRLRVTFIIGDSSPASAFVRHLATAGVSENCRFLARQTHRQVCAELARAWVAAVPSRSEGFGLVNIEAMSVRTPVVASRIGGIPEVVRDGLDGFLVPPADPGALAAKLGQLLADRVLRERLGQNGRQRFLESFAEAVLLPQQVAWLEGLVGRP